MTQNNDAPSLDSKTKPAKRKAWNSTLNAPTKPIRRTSAPPRKKGPAKVDRKRLKLRREEAFNGASGEKASFIRASLCAVRTFAVSMHDYPEPCSLKIDAAHLRSRGAGGDATHLVPLCRRHHMLQHSLGIATFFRRYLRHWDVETLTEFYERAYNDWRHA